MFNTYSFHFLFNYFFVIIHFISFYLHSLIFHPFLFFAMLSNFIFIAILNSIEQKRKENEWISNLHDSFDIYSQIHKRITNIQFSNNFFEFSMFSFIFYRNFSSSRLIFILFIRNGTLKHRYTLGYCLSSILTNLL